VLHVCFMYASSCKRGITVTRYCLLCAEYQVVSFDPIVDGRGNQIVPGSQSRLVPGRAEPWREHVTAGGSNASTEVSRQRKHLLLSRIPQKTRIAAPTDGIGRQSGKPPVDLPTRPVPTQQPSQLYRVRVGGFLRRSVELMNASRRRPAC